MLSNYISTIRRDDFLDRLNEVLRSRTSAASRSSAATIQTYYTNHPELRKYTLGVELDRDMDYTLILGDGTPVVNKAAIRSYFNYDESDEKLSQCQEGAVSKEELLIRAANQSLFADALGALNGSEDILLPSTPHEEDKFGLVLSGPILSMASVVEKCHFTVDLQRGGV